MSWRDSPFGPPHERTSLSDEHAKCDRLAARWNSCAAFPQSTHSEQQEQWADRTVHIIVHIIVGQTSGAYDASLRSPHSQLLQFTAPTRRTALCSATVWPFASPEAVATVPRSRSTGASSSAGCAQEPSPDGCQSQAQPVKRIIIRGSRPV